MKWFVKCLREYTNFRGRASRTEFWYFMFVFLILALIAGGVDILCRRMGMYEYNYSVMGIRLLLLLPLAAVQTRRLHDVGRSGWWVLGFWIVTALNDLSKNIGNVSCCGSNCVANFMQESELALALVFGLYALMMFYWFLKSGEEDANRYGPALKIDSE